MELQLNLDNTSNLVGFLGHQDVNLRVLEDIFSVQIFHRGQTLTIQGDKEQRVQESMEILKKMLILSLKKQFISTDEISILANRILKEGTIDQNLSNSLKVSSGNKFIYLKNYMQQSYIENVLKNNIVFGIGPAGTGKTYLAVAAALNFLMEEKVKKVILTRPVIEAGENLGFLPGSFEDKIDPYLKPLMDSILDMLSVEEISRYRERGQIEIAPLAYMRGRTLNNAFIILDEAQNTTAAQMKMFLTRFGHHSKIVVTGDITQKDIPRNQESGLDLAIKILKKIPGIEFTHFSNKDIVRHPLVIKIIEAFEKHEEKK